MPTKRHWTEAENALLIEMERAGRSTEDMARAIGGISRTGIREQCIRLGITRLLGVGGKPKAPVTPPQPLIDYHRDPLPAGHPIAWQAITAGTCLEGSNYDRG